MTAETNGRRVGVMHVTDTLDVGGLERVAVNLVNALPRTRFRAHLCTTRRDGPLSRVIAADVGRLRLGRRNRFDPDAVRRLAAYIRRHEIKIVHAHGSSLFVARAATLLARGGSLVWHDHFGRYLEQERPAWLYRAATHGIGGVIAVNESLAEWARGRLRMPPERVWYVPNFVCQPEAEEAAPELPGAQGARVVCVANLRPQKDHLGLLRAMKTVVRGEPRAHLLLVGGASDRSHEARIRREVERQGLAAHVSLLGEREDVHAILRVCDIGVLASASEGLPLALLEYGMAGLPTAATDVGQCAEVLDGGDAGLVVPPRDPEQLAAALLKLLRSPGEAARRGARLRARTLARHGEAAVTEQITRIYESALGDDAGAAGAQAGGRLRAV